MTWRLHSTTVPHSLEELEDIILQNRQVNLAEKEAFFQPKHPLELSLEELSIDLKQIEKAKKRIAQAAEKQEKVIIFGDYDADGICATTIMWEALRAQGVVALPFIPHRQKHGYGLSLKSLEAVLEHGKPDLLITVDNGVVAHEAFAKLKELGVDTILTDHHQPELKDGKDIFPPADIVVHTTKLCGSTVSWIFGREIAPQVAEKSLDLTVIATIADQMVLLGANRSFAVHGLTALRNSKRLGLQVLCARAELNQKELAIHQLNYGIVPRLNAMGRLEHGLDALRLLCTTSPARADALATTLNSTNTARQELTAGMMEHAIKAADEWKDEHIIVVSSTEYHEGVIGLIAGKLVEQFSKPAIVIAEGPSVAKASARSLSGINITELMRMVREDLLEVGGHPMAGGFGALPEKIPVVQERLRVLTRTVITKKMLEPVLMLDAELPAELVTLETCKFLEKFAPFGNGNREPLFWLKDLELTHVAPIGKTGAHLRFTFQSGPRRIQGVGWGLSHLLDQLHPGQLYQLAAQVSLNEWQGRETLQLIVKSLLF